MNISRWSWCTSSQSLPVSSFSQVYTVYCSIFRTWLSNTTTWPPVVWPGKFLWTIPNFAFCFFITSLIQRCYLKRYRFLHLNPMVWGSNPTDDHYFSLVLKCQCLMRPYSMELETGSRLVASAILCAQRFLGVRGETLLWQQCHGQPSSPLYSPGVAGSRPSVIPWPR